MAVTINFDGIPGYKPTIGGLRHLTTEPRKPPDGTLVTLLCGGMYRVGSGPKSPAIYDCSACDEVRREQCEAPAVQAPRSAPHGVARPPLDGRATCPVGAGDPDHPAPTGLRQESLCRY